MSADRLNATKQAKIQEAIDQLYGYGAVSVLMAWAGSSKRFDFVYTSPRTPGWHGHATISRHLDRVEPKHTHDKHEPCAELLAEVAQDV